MKKKIIAASVTAVLLIALYMLLKQYTGFALAYTVVSGIIISVGAGGSYLVSKYTGMGFLEPFTATAVAVPLLLIIGSQNGLTKSIIEIGTSGGDAGIVELGISVIVILVGTTCILCLCILAAVFSFYMICGITARKCRGKLVKIEKPAGKLAKFAFYRVDGKEYQCAVAGASKKLVIGNEYQIRLNRFQKKVYDSSLLSICLTGLIMWLFLAAFFVLTLMLIAAVT